MYYNQINIDKDDDVNDIDDSSNSSNRNTHGFFYRGINNLDFIDFSTPVIIMEYENLIIGFLVTAR